MARNKRVFPFFLDGGVQEVTAPSGSGTVAWNGTSSFVYVTGTNDGGTLTLGTTDSYGRPLPHGVLVTVFVDGSGRITVDTTSADMQDFNTDVTLGSPGETATFLFKAPTSTNDKGEWALIALNQRLTNVYDAVSFNSNVTLNGKLALTTETTHTDSAVVVSAGSGSGDAATITNAFTKPVSVVSGSAHVIFPAGAENGQMLTLINAGASAITVHPPAGRTTINGAASPYTLAANSTVTVYFPSATSGLGSDIRIY